MPTPWEALDATASAAIDRVMAERVLFTPMVSSANGRPQPDTARSEREVEGVFEWEGADIGIRLGVRKTWREANDLRSLVSGRKPVISVDRRWFGDFEAEPRQGDRVQLLDRPHLPVFQVSTTKRDGQSRIFLTLDQLGGQT